MKPYSVKRPTWGRKVDLRKRVADENRRKVMIYSALYGGAAAAFMMTAAAIATLH